MFLKRPEAPRGGRSCLFGEGSGNQPHRKRESQRDVSGCKNFVRTSLYAHFPERDPNARV